MSVWQLETSLYGCTETLNAPEVVNLDYFIISLTKTVLQTDNILVK